MSVLSNQDIIREVQSGKLRITPFRPDQVQPASYDFRVSDEWAVVKLAPGVKVFDWYANDLEVYTSHNLRFLLAPGEVVLAISDEWVDLPNNIGIDCKTKSSVGRIHIATANGDAGWYDPGFSGRGVMEIANHNSFPVMLHAGMRLGQWVFKYTSTPSSVPYKGNYVGQGGFLVERWLKNLEKLRGETKDYHRVEHTTNVVS